MPKQKTHKGAQKRLKVTAKKKVLHKKANKSHILTKKSSKRKRKLGRKSVISSADMSAVKDMLPYDF
ncbi:MAG: 50S ribosomal protein L35 [Acidobacteriota bacterium]|nr:50S ribosomal protein L35 [Acidobacteriota bacterium]